MTARPGATEPVPVLTVADRPAHWLRHVFGTIQPGAQTEEVDTLGRALYYDVGFGGVATELFVSIDQGQNFMAIKRGAFFRTAKFTKLRLQNRSAVAVTNVSVVVSWNQAFRIWQQFA
jgi:hypothetical protein